MIYSKILEMMNLFREVDEEVGGIVAIDGFHIWEHGLPEIHFSHVDSLVEIAGMLGKTIEIKESPGGNYTVVWGEFISDGIVFKCYSIDDAENTAIKDFNRAVIKERKDEFKKEMQK